MLKSPKLSTLVVMLIAITCLAASASASPLTWYVNGAFNDGGTITGSYVFDADTNTFSSVAVITTKGTIRDGADYLFADPCCTALPNFLLFVTTNVGDLTGTPVLSADLVSPMTDAGGTIALATSNALFFSEESCSNAVCGGPAPPERSIISGQVTTSVPEPGSLVSMFGLAVLGWGRLKAKRS